MVQPVLWAVMVSLAGCGVFMGCEPAVVVGHSQGEIAAACVAGALSLEDGARVVALRARLWWSCRVMGEWCRCVACREVRERLVGWGDRLGVAAVNGPSSVVVSGDPAALEELLAALESDEIRARRIPVDYASHSTQVEEVRERLLDAFAEESPQSAEVPFFSTVDVRWMDTTELDAEYWYRNVRQTVEFEQAIRALLSRGMTRLLK